MQPWSRVPAAPEFDDDSNESGSQQAQRVGSLRISRRTFCRSALIGSTLLGLMTATSGAVLAQADEPDLPEYEELMLLGLVEGEEETGEEEEPDLEDPSIDSSNLFLPLVYGGAGAQAASSGPASPVKDSLTAAAVAAISSRERALRAAISRVSPESRENPAGSNRTNYGKYFGVSYGAQWCAYFCSWCFDYTGNGDGRVPWSPGSVQGILDWARTKEKQGRRVLFTQPRRGDLLIMKGGGVSHVGIVRKVHNDELVTYVSGNTVRRPRLGNQYDNKSWYVSSFRKDLSALTRAGVPYYFVRVPKDPWR